MTMPKITDANHPPNKSSEVVSAQPVSGLGVASMILGIISFTGPGLLLGIPAIVMATIDLKRKKSNQSFAVAGLVTGIISTIISLVVIAIIIFLSVLIYNHPEEFEEFYQESQPAQQQSSEV